MAGYVVLVRSVNVGGHNRLPMKDFARELAAAGLTEVQTYIQSGNAVVHAPAGQEGLVQQRVAAVLAAKFGLAVPVVVIRAADWSQLVQQNPFVDQGIDPKLLHVAVLQGPPRAGAMLDPARSPGDAWHLQDRALYLHLPAGVSGSKLGIDYLERQLGTPVTLRNWATTLKLLAMLGE